jgi:hypothetical protein
VKLDAAFYFEGLTMTYTKIVEGNAPSVKKKGGRRR